METNIIDFFRFRFLPYWPIFILLLIISLTSAAIYWMYATPMYESTANILIKDDKKGTDDSKMLESLNIFTTKKIVEDEIEVLQSVTLAKEVVKKLHLYSPVSEQGSVKAYSAYITSPVSVEMDDFDSVYNIHSKVLSEKVNFKYDNSTNRVSMGKITVPVNSWFKTTYGNVRFIPNSRYEHSTDKPLFFTILNPKEISNSLVKNLSINEVSKLSSVVNITVRDEVPQRGEDIINELTNDYNRAGINDKNQLAINTLTFVEERLIHVKKELDSIESQIQQYKIKNGVVDLSAQSSVVLKNVGDNNQIVADVNMQLAVLDELEKFVSSKSNESGIVPSTLGVNDVGLSQLLEKLYDSETEYQKIKRTIGENNPMVMSLASEIEKIRPGILENIRIKKTGLKASLENLSSTNSTYSALLEKVPQKERGLIEITRRESILNNVYSFLLQKREETALSYSSTVPSSRTIDVAQSTIDPVSPKKIIIFGIAFVAALLLGGIYITLKDFFSNKIMFRKEIEGLTQFPVIGEISNTLKDKVVLVVQKEENAFAAEQFRHLIAAIGLYGKENNRKKLLITSSISGEGKSFISANLALSLALSGKKVVLLDMDLRNPELSSHFNNANEAGIRDFLSGDKEPYEIIKNTAYDKLFVIRAGNPSENRTELSFNHKLGELFNYLERVFAYIIIDTPPVEAVSDAYILSQYCDITLFVVRHNYTPKGLVKLLDENNKIKPLKSPGLIFNGVKSRGILTEKYGIEFGYGYENIYKSKISKPGKAGILS